MTQVKAIVQFKRPEEGGRETPPCDGYRGQFHYKGEEKVWDAEHYYIENICSGRPIGSIIHFPPKTWKKVHSKRMDYGVRFEICEGRRVVAEGIVVELIS